MKVDGQPVPRTEHLAAVSVAKQVNKLSWARLVFLDGSASSSDFPLGNADTFMPGRSVEVLAGPGNDPASLFKGVVVRQSLKVRDSTAPQLVVECRHAAVKLTVGRKSRYYLDQSDADIIGALLSDAGIRADVDGTSVTHKQQVQYASTDWDFLVARAEANGRLVLTNDDTVAVKAPSFGGAAAVTLRFGATLLELDADMDARGQYDAVKGFTWDPAQQSVVTKDAADPGVAGAGNVASSDLAAVVGLAHLALADAALPEDEAQAWADAEWLKSRMSKTSGRAKCEGLATLNPGDLVALAGVGDRFSGTVLVTGVRHEFDLVQGWKTHVQFGGVQGWRSEEPQVSAPRAGALLPGISGLQIGVTVSNEDPAGEFRVRVRLPLISSDSDGTWARVATLDAGDARGTFFQPEVGDEVVVGFLNDDPRQPVILGMLHSSARPAPLQGSDDNHEKVYQSRAKMKLYFNDDTRVIELATPAGNTITLSEEDKAITIADQNGNKLEMTQDGITLESSTGALLLKAGTDLKLEAGSSLGMKAGAQLNVEAASGLDLKSSGATKIQGSLVQIN